MNLPKIKAKLVTRSPVNYTFEELVSHRRFCVPIEMMHRIVDYPGSLIDTPTGELLTGSVIEFVVKNKEGSPPSILPDINAYPRKKEFYSDVSSDELATCILNFIDHISEIRKEDEREIVKALSVHNDSLACRLIRAALLLG